MESFDFGQILQGSIVTHPYRLTDLGSSPLTLQRVVPSCGCTTALLGRTVLQPGEATELAVKFNATGYAGPVRKEVQVFSDDPRRPVVTLVFQASVMRDVEPPSRVVWLEDLAPREDRKVSVLYESGTGEPIAVTAVEGTEAPWLGVATREEGRRLWVDLELLAKRLPPGHPSGVDLLVLHVENPRPSLAMLEVRWGRRKPRLAGPGPRERR
jgi:hypothetical protein